MQKDNLEWSSKQLSPFPLLYFSPDVYSDSNLTPRNMKSNSPKNVSFNKILPHFETDK